MLNMENAEEVMQILERFTRLKQKEIPKELDDYMHYVAKTGDTVFKWSSLKYLFREKLLNVIKNFHDTSPRVDDIPQYPNVDPFNYESMKSSLLERLELFNAAPFTVQRLCELLTEPRKQYSRIDKFMRALEKNILVSTIEPGRKQTESENGDSLDSVVNGDVSLDVNVDIEMENETIFNAAPVTDAPNSAAVAVTASTTATPATAETTTPTTAQPSSNLIHKSDDDILPNPKKAKLDLEGAVHDAETEAATKSIATANNKPESASAPINEVVAMATAEEKTDNVEEKKQNDETVPVSEEKQATAPAVEHVAEETKTDNNKVEESEKMEEDLPDSVAIAEAKDEVKSDIQVESEKKTEEEKKAAAPTPTAEVVQEKAEQPKAAAVVDSSVETKVEVTEKKEHCSQDNVEEITEKQKKNTDDAVKTSELKTETNIATTNDKLSETAVEEPAVITSSATDENKEKVEAATPVVVEKENEAVAATPTTATEEKTKVDDSKPADEAMTALEEKTTPVEDNKTPAESAPKITDSHAQDQIVTESPQAESVAKQDDITKSTEIAEKQTEKPSTTVEAAAVGVVEPTAEKEILESAEATPAEPTPAIEKPVVEKVVVEETASSTTDNTPAIVPSTDVSPATSTDEAKTDVAASTTEVIPPPAIVIAEPAVIQEPTLPEPAVVVVSADQPMEENPPETIAEAEPVVPEIVVDTAAIVVEEIVMGDSVEMATDIIEPAKDEPAGMEVDDTSQEAMDQ